MRQLALALSPPPPPSLENFVAGANAELLERLRELRAGRPAEAIVYLWGEAGSGRSHLLRASARAGLTLADDVEVLDAGRQQALFAAINRAREGEGQVLAAGGSPPAQLALREDLRTRLAWGLVYQVKPLGDPERAQYLKAEAAHRGLALADEVIGYLLARVPRDVPSLRALVERLDRASLERQRPVTLPLVREALRIEDQ